MTRPPPLSTAAPPSRTLRALPECDSNLAGNLNGLLWTYLRMLGCRADEADDLTQEALLIALKRNPAPNLLRPFLLRTAKNLFFAALRHQARQPQSNAWPTEWIDIVDRAWHHQAQLDDNRWLDALAECKARLKPRQQQALQQYYGRELSLRDAATQLGVRPNGLKTLLQRVRATLRTCIEGKLQ